MALERILQGSTATIDVTLLAGSAPTDPSPDAATVTITRADGAALVTAQAATNTGTGTFSYTLTPAQTPQLDLLTATWTFTSGGQQQSRQTRHEVVGGFLCTLADLAGVLTGLSDTDLAAKRVAIEERLEKALGYACVPRYALELRYARDGRISTRTPLRAVRSLSSTLAGTTYTWTAEQIAALTLESWAACGVWARGPLMIGYEHGRDAPDPDITEAALLLADEAYGSQLDGRVIRQQADNMEVMYAAGRYGAVGAVDPFVNARLNDIVRANALPAIR